MAAPQPSPIRVEVVDLESGLPEIAGDPRYDKAWVVGRRGGVPRGIVELDLTESQATVAEQLRTRSGLDFAPPTRVGPPLTEAQLPRISVVLPSIVARREELDRCLKSIDELSYPDFEVVLVDNRTEVPPEDFLADLLNGRRVRVVAERRPGISAARNAGVAASTGEVVVFTDDDVQVDPQWLRAIGGRFVHEPDLQAVTGLVLPSELDTPAQIWFEHYYGGFSGRRTFERLRLTGGRGRFRRMRVTVRDEGGRGLRSFAIYGVGAYGAGANMAFRRSALERMGGFDLTLGTGTPARGGEDLAALINVLWSGGSIGYEPAAVVFHQHRREYAALVRQLRANGIGFTAMLVSLVHRDRGHLWALASQLPKAAQQMLTVSVGRLRGVDAWGSGPIPDPPHPDQPRAYPLQLVLHELVGMVFGPVAYLRSQRIRRDQSRSPTPGDGLGPSGQPSELTLAAVARLLERTLEDVDQAARHVWLNTLGGSVVLPRTVRRLIYAWSGATMNSPPGPQATIIGDPHHLTIQRDVYLNRRVFIEANAPVTIGSGCALGMETMILTSHHPTDRSGRWSGEADGRPVSIGDRVWIGARAVILPGASIESDVVIAAGSVVLGPCLSHGLYAGVPAKRVKDLDPSAS